MKKALRLISEFLYGKMEAKQSVSQPSFTTTIPDQTLPLEQWISEFVKPFKNHNNKNHAIQLKKLSYTGKP